jgi:hypothetical protein
MKPHSDSELDALFQKAAADPRPTALAQQVSRGLEARVLQRLTRPFSWREALGGLASWHPATVAACMAVCCAVWSGPALADVMDESWLVAQTEDIEIDDPLAPDSESEIEL